MSQRKLKKQRKLAEESIEISNKTDINGGLRQTVWNVIRNNLGWLLIMTVVIFGLYANSLNANFVSDDYASITQNQKIGDFWFQFNGGNSMSLSNYLIYKVFGYESTIPYHLVAVLGYIIFCWLAYIILEIVIGSSWLTRLTMLFFAFHPIHVEAVTWISGRNYVIVSIYVMSAFLCLWFYLKSNRIKYLLLTLGLFVLAFCTDKPRAFVLFLVTAIYLGAVGFNKFKVDWAKVIGMISVAGVLFVLFSWQHVMRRINIVNSGYNASESIFYNPFFQYPTGISKYLQLMWFPVDLTLYHTMYVLPVWLNWAIILVYLTLIVYFYFKNKAYFFALAFIFAAVMPSIMPVKVSWLVAERYMFLGSLGFCMFLALVIMDLSRYLKLAAPVLVAVIVSYYGVRIVVRNTDWQTNHNLWVNTCQVSPNSHNAWNNIGDDYDKLQDYVNAIKGFTQSTIIKPNYADAYHNRANILYKIGRLDLARDSYETAIYYSPQLYQTYLSLTQIDLMEKKYDLAVAHAEKAVELEPDNPQNAYVLAVVYAQIGRTADAEMILTNILKQIPDYQPAIQILQQLRTMPSTT